MNNRNVQTQRAVDAATKLLTEPVGGSERPRHHRLIVSGGSTPDEHLRHALAEAARGVGADLLFLDFGRGSPAKGPRRVIVGITGGDGVRWLEDCALWSGENGGPLLVVPRGRDAEGHYAFDGQRLELRPGRPAPSLAAGMLRADRRLRATSATSRAEERSSWLHVHTAA